MGRDQYGHYVNDNGVEIRASTSGSGKEKIDIYDSCPAENDDHKSIHINFDSDTGQGTITDTTSGKSETTPIQCYLTTACMKHMKDNFDDNCHELTLLRWFRDKYVSKEDIEHYYEIAPRIVEAIEKSPNKDKVYSDIFKKVILSCVSAIENKNYEFAYKRYKSSVLELEESFLKPAVNV